MTPTKFLGSPYLQDADLTVYNGDVREVLRELPDESMHACITSPPFFGLRDYDVEGQIGLEARPDEWVAELVDVFEEVRRVLRKDGSLWVECGDSYVSGQGGRQSSVGELPPTTRMDRVEPGPRDDVDVASWGTRNVTPRFYPGRETKLKPKDVLGQPFLLAFALREAGWWWRGWWPWVKRNALPESVRDRPSVCCSMVLQFSRAPRYFFDGVAIEEPAAWDYWGKQGLNKLDSESGARGASMRFNEYGRDEISQQHTKWPRGVFDIPTRANSLTICLVCGHLWTQKAPEVHCGQKVLSHYAAFPPDLVERMILASTSAKGNCLDCGAPFERIVEKELSEGAHGIHRATEPRLGALDDVRSDKRSRDGFIGGQSYATKTLGWRPTCGCPSAALEPVQCAPSVVLDPFFGSGTTALVTRKLGRTCVGVELHEGYCRLAAARLAQLSLLAEGAA